MEPLIRIGRAALAATCLGCLVVARAHGTPTREEILAALLAARESAASEPLRSRLPVALRFQMTAEQEAPLFTVLAGGAEGDQALRYPMTHPLFAFEWGDGSLVLVDPGFDPAVATAWNGMGPALRLLGAKKMCVDPDAWDALRARRGDVRNVVFSHLHVDHVSGLSQLCDEAGALPVTLTEAQRTSSHALEQRQLAFLEGLQDEGCIALPVFEESPRALAPLPGGPGTFLVPVDGHTPGSQMVVGFVAGDEGVRAIVISGDVVNHRSGFAGDGRPKPWWYRTFVVREDETRQVELRRLLADLEREGFTVLVNHDLTPSLDTGLLPWSGTGRCGEVR